MLPGGLDVVGIFVVAPTQVLKDSQTKLRQVGNCGQWQQSQLCRTMLKSVNKCLK